MEKNTIENNKVIAILRGVEGLKLLRIAEAVMEGGVKLAEVAFSGDDTVIADEIAQLKRLCGDRMAIGAGTVLTTKQAEYAARAGAEFIFSPTTDKKVIATAKDLGLIAVSGALSPTEVAAAVQAGADYVKIFPANAFGAKYVTALKAPFENVKFIAASGVTADNIAEYLRAGYCAAGVSSVFLDKKIIEAGDFDEITRRAAALVEAAKI